MGFVLQLIIGFIIMCILIAISAIPIFIVQYCKKDCNNTLRWFLFILCLFIYMILSIICQHYGILTERKSIPITPLIILALIAGINLFNCPKDIITKNTEQKIAKNDNLGKSGNIIKKFFNRKTTIVIISLIISIIIFLFVRNYNSYVNKIDNYWEQPYTLTRIEMLQNEIDIFELKRQIPEKSYNNQVQADGYIYNMRLVKDNEYAILFDVWQKDAKASRETIVKDMQCIAGMFLKKEEQNKIKVLIRIASIGYIDTEEVFYDYIPSNVFNNFHK